MQEQPRIQRYDGIFLKDFFAKDAVPTPKKPAAEEIIAPPPAPTFSESELIAAQTEAQKKGYDHGYEDGLAETRSQQTAREQATQESLALIASAMQELHDAHQRAIAREQQETSKLAISIARKLVDLQLSESQESYLQAFIDRSIASLMQRPTITLHVDPELAEALQGKIEPMFETRGFTGALRIFPDSKLNPFDVRLAWDHGYIEQNLSTAWRDIEALVTQFTLHNATPSPAQE